MSDCKEYVYQTFESPYGVLILVSVNDELCLCDWASGARRKQNDCRMLRYLEGSAHLGDSYAIRKTVSELEEYFEGERINFTISLKLYGTEFQKHVWNEIRKIPFGKTASYQEIAVRIGKPKAVRAVAMAIGCNPISIIIPCHRVIGNNGKLTGYNGGLAIKERLLHYESGVSEILH